MKQDMRIRLADERDAQTLTDFNLAMARETEGRDLARAIVQAGVRSLFQHPEAGFYVVAEKDGRIAGSLMITREWSDWRNGVYWWIQSVYVRKEFRRQGVYRRLYEFVKSELARDENVCGFRLYVEKDNHIARKTYETLGMIETPYRMYEEGRDAAP
ncbi:MAG: GNAT family N-acetyltransferase [Candidatus Sumerlaeota bacterium]|nr:GNAT family N-acetyltransferase [Candidatus Sumerlaeota bacterium]